MIRGIVIAFAVLSLVAFPYPLTVVLSFAASLFVPWLALLLGLLADALYYAPGATLPYATVLGLILTLLAVFVRRFVRERIMQ